MEPIIGVLVYAGVTAVIWFIAHFISMGFVILDERRSKSYGARIRKKAHAADDSVVIWKAGMGRLVVLWLVDAVFVILILGIGFYLLMYHDGMNLNDYLMWAWFMNGLIVAPLLIIGVASSVFIEAKCTVRIVDEQGIRYYWSLLGHLVPRISIAWNDVRNVKGESEGGHISVLFITGHQDTITVMMHSNGLDELFRMIDRKVPKDRIDSNAMFWIDYGTYAKNQYDDGALV